MKHIIKNGRQHTSLWNIAAIGFLLVALCVATFSAAAQQPQQDQDNVPGYPVASGQADTNGPAPANNSPQESNPAPTPPPVQMANPQESAPEGTPAPNTGAAPANPPLPAQLTLPAGTVIQVRTNEWLSTSRNLPGDGFNATLAQPIVVGGWVVAQRGQNVLGRVSMVQKDHGTTKLGVQLSQLTFVDGQLLPIQTQLSQSSAGSDAGRNVGVVGGTTGTGAVIGAIAGGGTGAAVGAGVGAIAGLGIITTHGRPTVIPPETLLTFQLQAPVTISTDKSKFAFHPVSQQDYNANANTNPQRPQRFVREGNGDYPPPPPPPPYYGYPYAYSPYYYPYGGWGFYPGPFVLGFGYYGGFGRFGGRFR